MISIDGVGVELGGATVLEDVSLTVGEGRFLALVGPNGAGKTTLLRTCSGLVSPDSGRVTVAGDDVTDLSAREIGRRIATVPQETSLAFDFDVADVVAMGRTPHRSRFSPADAADREAVRRALERTDTARFADRSVGDLSGGERQRVVFARALAQETPVLLLDEPTANLDVNHRIRALSLARELADEGKTVVAAIHDLELAARFCDAVALLSESRLLGVGPPADVVTSEAVESAFGVRAAVTTNPVTGTRAVTALSEPSPLDRRVHVFGGGERTARVVGRLADAGIEVTAGVLPAGDVATATARDVAEAVVTAPPFESVSEDRREAVAELVAEADAAVAAAPLDAANAALARDADPLFAPAGVDAPANARSVPDGELLATLEAPLPVRSSKREP